MSNLKTQSEIVRQNLIYHLMDSSGNWMLPDNMKFLNEILNDVMKLCKLANDVSDVNFLPFSEYHDFHKWIKENEWYESAPMEYDNFNVPNSCIRLTISDLYEKWLLEN